MSTPNDYKMPKWHEATRVHDWKNSVPIDIRNVWHEFHDAHKARLAVWAEELSDLEHWE